MFERRRLADKLPVKEQINLILLSNSRQVTNGSRMCEASLVAGTPEAWLDAVMLMPYSAFLAWFLKQRGQMQHGQQLE